MKNKSIILAIILLFTITNQSIGQENKTTKIGKVNLALLSALHPQMGLFDFQRMGFIKAELGLNKEAFEGKKMVLKMDNKDKEAANKALDLANEEMMAVEDQLRQLNDKEGTIFVPDMSEEGQKEYEIIRKKFNVAGIKRKEAEYRVMYPEFTEPAKTREILDAIEKEVIEVVNLVAKAGGYDVVLNSTVASPYGYPISYRPEVTYSTGPVGLDQVNYYTLLSERPEGREQIYDATEMAEEWLSTMFRPQVQDMLPMKPWPLVMSGGDDLLPAALKELYRRYKINDVTFGIVIDVLSAEENKN